MKTVHPAAGAAKPDSGSAESDGLQQGPVAFGAKLRAHRKSRRITLLQLADWADLSPGLISQIERGVTSPSLRTLSKLRNALELPTSFFFEEEPGHAGYLQDPSYICRAGDRPRLDLGLGAPHKELLHHGGSRVFEMMIVEIPPAGDSGPKVISYPSEKGGMILQGQLELTVDGRRNLLDPGDSFLFDGSLPHQLRNPLDAPTRLLWIIAKLPNLHPF
ncbi:MAG TPA: cupin domain-containing protein [Bordetella sp.]